MNSNSIDKFEEKASDQWLSGVEFTKTNGQFNIGKAAEYLPPAVINAILQESNIILLFDLPCAIKAETKEVFRPIMAHDTMPSVYILQHEGLATNGRDTQHFNTRGIKYQWFIFNNGRELKSDETEQASAHIVKCHVLNELDHAKDTAKCKNILKNYLLLESIKDSLKKNLKQKIDNLDFDDLINIQKVLNQKNNLTTDNVEIIKNVAEVSFDKKSLYHGIYWNLIADLEGGESEQNSQQDMLM